MDVAAEMEVMPAMSMSPAMSSAAAAASEDEGDLKRGPWTVEEDALLVDYIASHGEGRWNSLARCAGLRRTGKSCRLRWLNYLRPDVRRGNISPEEQLLILDLHSRWGNRWSKIAQHLPGRTDNEIKNYWRTRVQKHAKQLNCDVNSKQFRHVVRYIWMPRLLERIQADDPAAAAAAGCVPVPPLPPTRTMSSPAAAGASSSSSSYQHQYQQLLAMAPLLPPAAGAYHNDRDLDGGDTSSEPSQTMFITMSPDDASSTLRPSSPLTTEQPAAPTYGGVGAHHHFTSPQSTSPATEANGVVFGAVGAHACGGGDQSRPSVADDVIHGDVLSGSWSELLASTGRDASTADDLPYFDELGDLEDNVLWSLDDIWLQQQTNSVDAYMHI